jgi:hypothetical protein
MAAKSFIALGRGQEGQGLNCFLRLDDFFKSWDRFEKTFFAATIEQHALDTNKGK